MRRTAEVFLLLGLLAPSSSAWAISGVQVGNCWTDYDGTNYCGDSGSSSSSYDSGYSYDYSGYSALGEAMGQAGAQLGEALIGAWADSIMENARREAERTAALENNKQGNIYFKNGDYATAISYYESALQTLPNDRVIQKNLSRARGLLYNDQGVALHDRGDYADAIARYRQALEHQPEDLAIRGNLTRAEKQIAREKLAGEARALQARTDQIKLELLPSLEELFGDLGPGPGETVQTGGGMTFLTLADAGSTAAPADFEPLDFEIPEDLRDAPAPQNPRSLPIEPMPDARVKDPGLEVLEPGGVPLDGKPLASEQLRSAEYHGRQALKMGNTGAKIEAGKIFDSSEGSYQGGLEPVQLKYTGMGKEALPIPEARRADPALEPLAAEWMQTDRAHRAVETQLEQLEAKGAKTSQDYVEMARVKQELTKIENEKHFIRFRIDEKLREPPAAPETTVPAPKRPPVAVPEPPAPKGDDEYVLVE